MLYSDFQGVKLSRLGFGMMRLPVKEDKSVDLEEVVRMTDYAMAHGVNYFDTAYPYHGGTSELAAAKALVARYPRDSFYLADKYPGHQIVDMPAHIDPSEIFEEQLDKCGVTYFDFYLLHNINENSLDVYMDPKREILDYFLEQKKLGRIKHLGFSSHARPENLKKFLDWCGDEMEFCQIQLNYLDWSLQRAKESYELLTERGIPVWVMEPVRGGKLASFAPGEEARLKALRPEESAAAWAFRWLQGLDNVKVVLSGMTSFEQMVDNVKTFEDCRPLNEAESQLVYDIAGGLAELLPCTACRYCCDGCPMGLDIPVLLNLYNDLKVADSLNISMHVEAMTPEELPAACIGCGACAEACPQKIDIPAAMSAFAKQLETLPSWASICRERAAAAEAVKRAKAQANG